MKTIQIIMIAIIVASIAGIGIFGYLSFNSPPKGNSTSTTETASVLPLGSNLDFSKLKQYNPTGRKFQYPVVAPSDIGLQINDMVQLQPVGGNAP